MDVKPITQTKLDLKYYQPGKYLKPFDEQRAESTSANKDVSLNSLAYNKVINMKKQVEDGKKSNLADNITSGRQLDPKDFARRTINQSPDIRMSHNGKLVAEKILQASKDEQEYYLNKKIYTKEQSQAPSHYKAQIPDYMRVLDRPNNKTDLEKAATDGMISVISKNQGWITLSPRTMNRKNPVERGAAMGGDVTKTSILTPSWMQIGFPRNSQDFMRSSIQGGLKQENN